MASSDYKKRDREVKGYVEVLYDVKQLEENDYVYCYYYNAGGRTSQLTPFQYGRTFSQIISSPQRVIRDYAILYSDYTKLDGSFMLFNKSMNYCGFISNETPNSISTFDERNVIFEVGLNSGISGITFYFKDNTIKNATVYLYKSNSSEPDVMRIINNVNETLFIDSSDGNYTHMIVETTEWTNGDLPIWIKKIDLGLSHVYYGNELIEFEVTEQVDKLVEETPSNELKLTVGDYNHLYDPLNPNGIAKFLTEGSTFVPHIGIVLDDGSVEYEKMGVFYFNTIDYNEKEVTMTCYNLMDKISKKNITNDAGYLGIDGDYVCIPKEGIGAYLHHYIEYEYGEYFDELKSNNYITLSNKIRMVTKTFKMTSLANFLQNAVMIDGIFYFDRDNNLVVREVDKTITNSVTKNELLRDIKYTNVEKVTSFDLERTVYSISSTSETNDKYDFETSFTLESTNQVIALESDDINSFYNMQDSYLTVTGASSYHIIKASGKTKNDFNFLIFILVTGTVGSTISIKGKRPYKLNVSQTNEVTKIGTNASLLTINNPFYTTPYWEYDDMFTNFFKKTYSYKVNLDYNGNPTIKAGNYIQVESNYGMVPIFVQKHTLKFNGGLSGSIEGVE